MPQPILLTVSQRRLPLTPLLTKLERLGKIIVDIDSQLIMLMFSYDGCLSLLSLYRTSIFLSSKFAMRSIMLS